MSSESESESESEKSPNIFSVRVERGQHLGVAVMSLCQLVAHQGGDRFGVLSRTDFDAAATSASSAAACRCPRKGAPSIVDPRIRLRLAQSRTLFGERRRIGYAEIVDDDASADETMTAHCENIGYVKVLSNDDRGRLHEEAKKNFVNAEGFIQRYIIGNPLVEVELVGFAEEIEEKKKRSSSSPPPLPPPVARHHRPAEIFWAVSFASGQHQGVWPTDVSAVVFHFNTGVRPHFKARAQPLSTASSYAVAFGKLFQLSGFCARMLFYYPGFMGGMKDHLAGNYISLGLQQIDRISEHLSFISTPLMNFSANLPQAIVVALSCFRVSKSLWYDIRAMRDAPPSVKCEAALHLLLTLMGCASLILMWGWAASGPAALTAAVGQCVAVLGPCGVLLASLKNIMLVVTDRQSSIFEKARGLAAGISMDAMMFLFGVDAEVIKDIVIFITQGKGLIVAAQKKIDAVVNYPLMEKLMPDVLETMDILNARWPKKEKETDDEEKLFIQGIQSAQKVFDASKDRIVVDASMSKKQKSDHKHQREELKKNIERESALGITGLKKPQD